MRKTQFSFVELQTVSPAITALKQWVPASVSYASEVGRESKGNHVNPLILGILILTGGALDFNVKRDYIREGKRFSVDKLVCDI